LASAVKNTPANGDDLSVGGVTAARAIPVAVEISVAATGAKPTQGKGQRELFTEQTSTVLVLPDGAVIRLAAAVTQSQLIFLTNNTTKREVVCQVLRKRSYRPTSCYVELQFTEATPDFWGVDFLTEEAVSAGSQVGEEVAAAETVVEGPPAGVAAPSDKEVLQLREEVETLRTQLQSLLVKKDENAATPAAAEVAGAQAGTGSGEDSLEHLLPQVELDFSKMPANAGTGLAGANRKPALVDPGILRVGGLVLVLAAVLAGAWYENWLPILNRSAAPVGAATAGNAIAKPAKASGGSATPALTSANGNAASGIPVAAAGAQPIAGEVKSGATAVALADAAKPPTGTAAKTEDSDRSARKNSGAGDGAGKNSRKHGGEKAAAQPTDAAPDAGSDSLAISPAKLLHPVNPVYPPDAMRNYITGDVKLDAVVEADGRVGAMSVLSGPAPLRAAAMEALKQYKYAPAAQNGKGVASHVKVTIKFWFDP
jgi:TonB family protein